MSASASVRTSTILSSALLLAASACGDRVVNDTQDVTARPASKVEIKVTIAEHQVDLAREVLGLAEETAEVREVTFYDTPDLQLYEAGIILRARKVAGGDDDATVKIRPLESKDVDRHFFGIDGFKCEIDRVGSTSTSACSLKIDVDGDEIDEVGEGSRSVKKLFDDDQEELLDRHGVDVPWDELVPLGPVDALVWTTQPQGLTEELDVELWTLPGEAPILEVSTKVKKSRADAVSQELEAFLFDAGLDASNRQETKTRVALEHFSEDAGY